MSSVETARGLLELMRPVNSIAAGGLTFVGAFVAGGVVEAWPLVSAAVLATVCGTGAGNAINDYFDREIDAINQPGRVIPRGAVSARGALAWSLVLFGLAVAFALTLPLLALAIAVINLVALVTYTQFFKGLPGAGNALVAYLGGSTFLFGSAAATGDLVVPAVVLFALAAFSTIAREIVKDVEDLAGDREEGLNTLPIAIGARRALWVAAVVLGVAVAASPVPYLLGDLGVVYLAIVVPASGYMAYAMAVSFRDPTAGQSHLKYGMFVAALAFVLGRLAVVAPAVGA